MRSRVGVHQFGTPSFVARESLLHLALPPPLPATPSCSLHDRAKKVASRVRVRHRGDPVWAVPRAAVLVAVLNEQRQEGSVYQRLLTQSVPIRMPSSGSRLTPYGEMGRPIPGLGMSVNQGASGVVRSTRSTAKAPIARLHGEAPCDAQHAPRCCRATTAPQPVGCVPPSSTLPARSADGTRT